MELGEMTKTFMTFTHDGKWIIHNSSLPLVGGMFIMAGLSIVVIGIWLMALGTTGVK